MYRSTSSGLSLSCQKAVEALLYARLTWLSASDESVETWEASPGTGNEAAMTIVNADSVKLGILIKKPGS
jgi:hypothetical protein